MEGVSAYPNKTFVEQRRRPHDLTACQKEPGIVEVLTRDIWVGNFERMKHIKFDLVPLLLTCCLGIPGDQ